MSIRAWVGEKLVRLGLRVMGYDGREPPADPEVDGYDHPFPPVVIEPEARAMCIPPSPSPAAEGYAPLAGSAAWRRQRAEKG